MYNPIRRNRNIGTKNQGLGNENLFKDELGFSAVNHFDKLNVDKVEKVKIKGKEFTFIQEKLKKDYDYYVSIDDLVDLMQKINIKYFSLLKFIVFAQPPKKEEILQKAWGRFLYSMKFRGEYSPAIVLNAININKKFKWSKKLLLNEKKELERLRNDGHKVIGMPKYYEIISTPESIRNTHCFVLSFMNWDTIFIIIQLLINH